MKPHRILAVLVLVAVVTVSGVFSVLSFVKGPFSSTAPRGELVHPNVPPTCPAGEYVADHSCVLSCPPGFRPVSNYASANSICMSPDNSPVSVYDLAGLWVSADKGATIYLIVETVPLAKMPQMQNETLNVWMPVSRATLDTLPTIPIVPMVTILVATIGDQVGFFTIRQIGPNVVVGDLTVTFPTCCRSFGLTVTLGDDVGISCEGFSMILESIDFYEQIAVFQRRTIIDHFHCPVCLSGDTNIDTPNGPVNVKNIRVGQPVWTVDRFGRKVAGTVLQVKESPVPSAHGVVHIVLQDGRQLYASPAHPTADGRSFGELMVGGILDNSVVSVAELVPYNQPFTYDLLPSGDTGFYWANGILVGSTLSST